VRRWAFDLYVLTDLGAARGDAPYLEALGAGVPGLALQVRDAGGGLAEVARRFTALAPAARRAGVPVLLGVPDRERLGLAVAARVDGVHLPERGPSVAEVRAALGPAAWIGASVHDVVGLRRRLAEGADFVVLGPIGEVAGKGTPLPGPVFADAVQEARDVPVLALGGVRAAADVAWALARGARGVAVLSSIASSPDGAAAAHTLRGWLDEAREAARFADLPGASR
jgi:thiamine-phosphate pyrophosphorylase